ncbi:MAG: sulfatase [Opitutales bacterium]|nr:sulfatase [Opitutales bacterium]
MKSMFTRRQMLSHCSNGFGLLALHGVLGQSQLSAKPHYTPKAKSVIFCYMSGGVSQVDSFDPKPTLQEYNGRPMPMKVERTQFNNNGNVFPSPFQFANYGQSGIPVSSIFPHTAKMVDDMAVIRSMTSKVNEHAQGNYAIHTGFPFMGHPTAGAWVSYGLGALNQNLPRFVVLHSGGSVPPHGGVGLYGSGYLPANNQGSILQVDMNEPIRNVKPHEPLSAQRKRLDFHKSLDRHFLSQTGNHPQVEAAIRNHEVAYKMQAAVPELCDLKGESEATKKLYGLDSSDTQKAAYARQCLLARRLVERGVRFVELSCLTEKIGAGGAANPWDQHGALEKGHAAMAHQVDQPIAGLLQDLKVRGLLDETLVIWAGEFGRTPFSQGSNGRDHNPYGFSIWMAGGGIKGGTVYGSTDDFGYHVTENKCDFYDLWATVLHLLGLDHENLTYRHGGRDLRLTDVHGRLLHPILA